MIEKYKGILCISNVDWDGLCQRHHYIMNGIEIDGPIIYINNFGLRDAKISDYKKIIGKVNSILKKENKVDLDFKNEKKNNIHVINPAVIPIHSNPFIRKINTAVIKKLLKKQIKEYNLDDFILWIYNPSHIVANNINSLGQSLTIYDCVDDMAAFSGVSSDVIESEKIIINNSDIVFTTSKELFKKHNVYKNNCEYIPNGVKLSDFSSKKDFHIKEIENLKAEGKPVIGFIGAVHDWVDLDLVYDAAITRPNYNFVIVGPVGEVSYINKFKDIDNVHFLGKQAKERVPYFIEKFDVCMIPFKCNELTKSVNPLKLYEYLCMKKNVVTTGFADFGECSEYIYISKSSKDFIDKIDQSLQSKFNEDVMDIVSKYDWNNICTEVEDIINKYENK